MRVLFVSDTHIGFDWPTRPRVVRRRRGDDFFQNFARALEPARAGEIDVVVHGGDLLDVIRTADLPRDVAVTLSGHIHRHQVLRQPGRPPVIYAGSIERTSFAEAQEVKGFVVLHLTESGLASFEFRPLPARPMVTRTVFFGDANAMEVYARLTAAIESTPDDAVVQLRVTGAMPASLTARTLRAIAGARTVTLAIRTVDRRTDDESEAASAVK